MDDPNDLTPWYYTAMLTGRQGDAGEDRAFAAGVLKWLIHEADADELSPHHIRSENARVRDWLSQRPAGVKYCFELDAIHEDLDWLLSEISTACGPATERPGLMRNAVVYHVHNYHYRVHAYLEKLAQLINGVLNLGLAEKREVNAERVRQSLRCQANPEYWPVYDLLNDLMNDPQVRAVIERRTLLTHRALVEYRSGKGKWRIITAETRAQQYFDAGISHEMELWSNLEAFCRHELAEMRKVVARLEGFRDDLTHALRKLALRPSPYRQKRRYAVLWGVAVTRVLKRLSNFSVQRSPRRRR